MYYITLNQFKRHKKLMDTTVDDEIILDYIAWSSNLIDMWKDRSYDLRLETLLLDAPVPKAPRGGFGPDYTSRLYATSQVLRLGAYDVVAIKQLLNGDDTEIFDTSYIAERSKCWIQRIFLMGNSGVAWQLRDGEYRQAIRMKAWISMNIHYPDCFRDTNVAVGESALGASVTELTGLTELPDVEAHQLCMLGEELVLITSVEAVAGVDPEPDTYTLSFLRGQNGTTAIEHPAETKLILYLPPETVVQMCMRLVHWRYAQKDTDNFDRTFDLATQVSTTPSSLPADVRLILGARGRFKI